MPGFATKLDDPALPKLASAYIGGLLGFHETKTDQQQLASLIIKLNRRSHDYGEKIIEKCLEKKYDAIAWLRKRVELINELDNLMDELAGFINEARKAIDPALAEPIFDFYKSSISFGNNLGKVGQIGSVKSRRAEIGHAKNAEKATGSKMVGRQLAKTIGRRLPVLNLVITLNDMIEAVSAIINHQDRRQLAVRNQYDLIKNHLEEIILNEEYIETSRQWLLQHNCSIALDEIDELERTQGLGYVEAIE